MTAPARPSAFSARAAAQPHAIVVGSGFGGLAAAVRLGARGYRVTVLERLDEPGGRASVFRQDGFTFDAGPTIVTAPFLFEELWTLAGRRMADDVTLTALDPFYRIRFNDGSTIDCSGDETRMRAEIARLSPNDVNGYEAFLKLSREVYKTGFVELGDVPFDRWTAMLGVAPDLVRLGAHRSVYGTAAKYVRDERLRTLLSFHPLFIGGNPFSVTALYVLISWLERAHGVHFAMGGTGALVKGLVGLIEGQGNTVLCGREVTEILVEGRRATGVRLANGETLRADVVVSNADSAWTLRKMLPERLRGRWTDRKLDRARYSMSLFVWYFGTNRRYEDVPHHTILMGPRYRELLADIFRRKVLAEDFSLYLHRPTATDPSLAPPGCDAFYALSPVPNLEGEVDWDSAAEPYRQRIARHLEETLLPGLGDAVVTSRLMTPLDFRDRYLAYRGAAFGLEPILTQSAWFRPHNRFGSVERLYLVGAGTHPGAGLPGVLTSAKILDEVVPDAAALSH
ncbi:phytoene desaturase [Prosthecomicrobium sp. N25]|uniref:phytoene desaturase n=1 Tax=Prosthecomicrobium sp. N25 TaxID=3129254 RepID=UPI003076B8D3